MRIAGNEEKKYYQTAANNILLYSELRKVVETFKKAGVPVILLKGAVLAKNTYRSIALRSMGDLDLLISRADLDRAREILKGAGYKELSEPRESINPFRSVDTGEVVFWAENGVLIDLHWSLTSIEWLRWMTSIDDDLLWKDAQPFKIDGLEMLQLSTADMLLHLCLHLAAHNYAHSIGYHDIFHLIEYPRSFSWEKFLSRAIKFRLRAASYFPLATVAAELGAPIPISILEELKPQLWQRLLVLMIANPSKGLSGELDYNRYRSYLLHLSVADRARDVVMVIFRLLFPGPRWLAQRYHLKKVYQILFACLWHPLFVLAQGLLGFREVLIEERGR